MDQRSEVLRDEYQKRFEANAAYRDGVWRILCQDFFSQYIAADSTLLDLGAGWGEFSRNIVAQQKYAMDLNPECGARIAGHAEFLQQDCSNPWPLADNALDVVFTSNFLEHLPSKSLIEATLAEALRCLKPGGKFIAVGPNIKFIPGVYWDYWDHFIPISDSSMAEVLSLQGFQVIKKIDRFLPYTMSGSKNPPLIAVKLFLALPIVWQFFGKQFLIVAQKP